MNISDIKSKELERAARKAAAQRSFIQRNFWLWVVVAFLIYPLAAIFSAFTEGGHIYLRAKAALGEGAWAIAITVVLVVMIELLKFFLGKGAVDDFQANPFSEGGSALAAFAVKALGFIGIMYFSVTLSVKGAGVMNEYMRKNYKPVTTEAGYVDENAIIQRYEQELLPHRDNIRQFQSIRWKGTITVDARRMIRKEQDMIDKIIAARDIELARVRAGNDEMKTEWEDETVENSTYAMGFAGVGELICLFSLLFIGIYDDGIKRERGASPIQASVIEMQPAPRVQDEDQVLLAARGNIPPPASTPPSERRQIGFGRNTPDVTAPDIRVNTDIPVATGGHLAATQESQEVDMEIRFLIGSLKNARSERAKWTSKLDKKDGKDETNLQHIRKWEAQISDIITLLERKGYNVDSLV